MTGEENNYFINDIEVFVEISKGSHIKYEYDTVNQKLVCDRILQTPFKYFFNYGFIPKTLSDDGDPLDVVILMEDELIPGSSIQCKIIGCLETTDDEGYDPKIIACPTSKIDPTYDSINGIKDVPSHKIDKIKYFFSHYKDIEKKSVEIGKLLDVYESIDIYKQSQLDFVISDNIKFGL